MQDALKDLDDLTNEEHLMTAAKTLQVAHVIVGQAKGIHSDVKEIGTDVKEIGTDVKEIGTDVRDMAANDQAGKLYFLILYLVLDTHATFSCASHIYHQCDREEAP